MKTLKDKVIRDAVHGNIIVSKQYVETILDTDYFQRLRRVEQTSIRSVYPSARHDRFIHSLGVYYVGGLIAKHLVSERRYDFSSLNQRLMRQITESYKVACLVHDIAHAPFSHTFEYYYGNESDLYQRLNKLLDNKLSLEGSLIDDIKPHEYASAIVVADERGLYPNIRKIKNVNVELVCRMIIGAEFAPDTIYHQIANCFIKLLHGDVLDADRIDYACRDVWASGYRTATIDIERIVAAIHIHQHKKKYEVCYDYNALTEITNMLEIRQFQNLYIINHHTVQYEQNLMILAAEEMALSKYPNLTGHDALMKIISVDSLLKNTASYREYPNICDDDLWYLIKHTPNNSYYDELSKRQYTHFALWKNIGEFYAVFQNVSKNKEIYKGSFKDDIKKLLRPIMQNDVENIIFCEVKFKADVNINKLPICVGGHHISYEEAQMRFFGKETTVSTPDKMKFQYVYVPYPKDERLDLQKYKQILLQELNSYMTTFFGKDAQPQAAPVEAQPASQQEGTPEPQDLEGQEPCHEAQTDVRYGDGTIQ